MPFKRTMTFTCYLANRDLGEERAILANLKVHDCCKTYSNETSVIHFPTNSCKLQKIEAFRKFSV